MGMENGGYSFIKYPKKEESRDQLRNELIWSGFAPLSNSAWISPNDLKEQVYTIEKNMISLIMSIFLFQKILERNQTHRS